MEQTVFYMTDGRKLLLPAIGRLSATILYLLPMDELHNSNRTRLSGAQYQKSSGRGLKLNFLPLQMKRHQFNNILINAVKASKSKLIIIGSQAFFASTNSDNIPDIVELSDEVDVCPEDIEDAEVIELSAGRGSEIYNKNGVYAHALEYIDRHILTEGWKARLIPYKIKDGKKGKEYEVFCLSLLDICVNKLCWGREKDYRFISNVVSGGYITMEEIESLVGSVKENFRKILAKNIEKSKDFIRQNKKTKR